MSKEEKISKKDKKDKVFNKTKNKFFKENKPEDWSFLNFLDYRYIMQTTQQFTNARCEK